VVAGEPHLQPQYQTATKTTLLLLKSLIFFIFNFKTRKRKSLENNGKKITIRPHTLHP